MKKIRALSVRQPYADRILSGEKGIEYRSFKTNIRGTVYVYASKQGEANPRSGYVIGTVDIIDCIEVEGSFHWLLKNPKRINKRKPDGIPQPTFFYPFGR